MRGVCFLIWLICFLPATDVAATSQEDSFAYEMINRTSATPALTRDVNFARSEDGHSASVRFAHGEKQYEYQLSLVNVYTEDAEDIAYTDKGIERRTAKSSNTFRSRVDGRWASATLEEDGSVSGIFEDGDKVIELKPHDGPESEAALLQTDYAASGPLHIVRVRAMQDIALEAETAIHYRGSLLQVGDDFPTPGPMVIDQDKINPDGGHSGILETDGSLPHNDKWGPQEGEIGAYSIQRWFPGCYSGDTSMHKVVLGVIADVPAFKRYGGSGVRKKMEGIVNEASQVYEKQMNIRLAIGSTVVHESDSSAPNYAKTPRNCNSGDGRDTMNWMVEKMNQFTRAKNPGFEAAWHLFTGCDSGKWGILGIARMASLCNRQEVNCAVNQLYINSPWLTFAHELGHQFNGAHTFEEGEGKTGGILDYGDNHKINGVYQFNTKYRKGEMCRHMSRTVGRCEGKFDKTSGGSPSPTPKAPRPPRRRRGGTSPSPSQPPRRRGGKGGKGGEPTPTPVPSPTPSGPETRRRSGRGGKGSSPEPSPTPSSPTPSSPASRRRRRGPAPPGGERRRTRRRRSAGGTARRRRRRR